MTEGELVFAITYDEDDNEVRVAPADAGTAIDRSRDLGVGATGLIVRVKHGPFVVTADELRVANSGSLAEAIKDNYFGSALYVDLTSPPVDVDLMELDDRYHLDVRDDQLVAIVTERYSTQPPFTASEMAASLGPVAAAYACRIVDVSLTLVGGSAPEEFLISFTDSGLDPEHAARLEEEQRAIVASMAHEAVISLAGDSSKPVGELISAASALADYLKATRHGPLDASGVVNLLRGGHFELLVGETESDFLEVKTTMHPIGSPGANGDKAKIELAQDVARFANGEVDAVLVIGYREASGGRNEIGSVTPVANTLLDPARVTGVLDARIVPPLDGLRIETFPITMTEGIMTIFVPRQPPEMQPYLVHGAIVEGKVEGAFFSIVRRRGEASITTSAQQIHAYIVAGKRYLRGDT